ncbi:MAG TPA: O-antigen ligase family protein [Dehalococcoidia bacterium]|nr:O-antigen ligase family protein [Dehalococcoidia bacterium]
MIVEVRAARRVAFPTYLLLIPAAIVAALLAARAIAAWEEFAAAYAVFGAVLCVTVWRPRYGLYALVVLALMLENQPRDQFAYWGDIAQSTIATWGHISFLIFSPIELLTIVLALSVLGRAVVFRRWPAPTTLAKPLLFFLACVAVAFAYGVLSGGTFTIAMWEVRSLVLAALIAFLVPSLVTSTKQVEQLINVVCFAMVVLAADILIRRFTLLSGYRTGTLDLVYDHESPIFINFAVIVMAARMVWPATRLQRLAACVVPLLLVAEMVTERRAGWVGLDMGLGVILVFAFRLRRKFFYLVGVPLLLFYGAYLVAYWNGQGTTAQPARAVRSLSSPDARDAASNAYRLMETANIRANIHAHPIVGLGFGHEYTFYDPLPDLSWWLFWHFEAHNTFLWLWMEAGPVGFAAFLALMGSAIVRGVHLLRRVSRMPVAPYVVGTVIGIMMVVMYTYVDLGLTSTRLAVFLGLLLGFVGAWTGGKEWIGEPGGRRASSAVVD